MGLFEDSVRAALQEPEGRVGWAEAEAELAEYYASSDANQCVKIFLDVPEGLSVHTWQTCAVGNQTGPATRRAVSQYAPPIVEQKLVPA
jgi:hypothetical protein